MSNFFDGLNSNYGDRKEFEALIEKSSFYNLMKKHGFDFEEVEDDLSVSRIAKLPKCLIPVVNNDIEEFHYFNSTLAKLHRDRVISILDVVLYLVNDFFEPSIVLRCLDEVNFYLLKNEMQSRYKIGIEENELTEFLQNGSD